MTSPATGIQRKALLLLVAVAVMAVTLLLPLPQAKEGQAVLTQEGRATLAVLLFCLVLWMTEPLPFHITGLLSLVLLALLRADSFSNLVRYGFGNDTIVFFIGVLTMSACITRAGLGRRMSLLVLRLTGNRTSRVLLGLLIAGALLGMWVTTVAAAAMLMPLAVSIANSEGLQPGRSRFGKGLFIAVAWGSLIGGIGSPAGSGANPIAIGFVREMLGMDISFTDWMLFGLPCMLALIPPSFLVLMLFFKPEQQTLSRSAEQLRAEYQALPPMESRERNALIILCLVMLLWLFGRPLEALLGMRLPTALPALLGACLFFLPGVSGIKWQEVQNEISWSGILLIASGVSLGMLMYQTGAARWLSTLFMGGIVQLPPFLRSVCVILVVAVLKLGLSSNSVTATVVIPIMIGLTGFTGHPLSLAIPAAMTMNTAYVLVTSSPTNVITYASGHFSIADMAKSGAVFTLLAAPVMAAVITLVSRLAGIV